MAREFDSLDEFLNHTGRKGSANLTGWKKDGSIVVWYHTKRLPLAIWRHPWPAIVGIENKDLEEQERRVFSKDFVCHEDDDALEEQHFYDRATGMREKPLTKCGLCMLIEWLHRQCFLFATTDGKRGISWTTPVFRYEGDRADETRVLRAGGICGLFGKKNMTAKEKQALHKAGVNLEEDWNQNAHAKMQYVMCVVDDAHPADGVRIAIETSALGTAVKTVIRKRMKSKGKEEGSILLNPYAIEWEYKKEEQFAKKYDATILEDVKLTPAIRRLIEGPPPDLTRVTRPFNQVSMRAALEKACLLPKGVVPWDELFPPSNLENEGTEGEEESEGDATAPPSSAPAGKEGGDADDDMFACDGCEKPMKATDPKCPHCGMTYEVEQLPPPPPPKQLKKRSEAAKERATAADKPAAKAVPKAAESERPPAEKPKARVEAWIRTHETRVPPTPAASDDRFDGDDFDADTIPF